MAGFVNWIKRNTKTLIWLAICFGVFLFNLYNSRQIFYYHYDPEYYENLYYNSQWNVPQSTRGISDGELYKFVGYRLAYGENPFNINYETPPAGKYLYGLAIRYLGNPYYFSILCYLGIGVAIYLISNALFRRKNTAFAVVLLYLVTPFTATQIRETMLDLPITLFFSLFLLFLVRYLQKDKLWQLLVSGVFLGIATGTKFGAFTPLLICFSVALLFLRKTKLKHIFLYLPAVAAGYVLAFFCYFIKHPNPIPWIRLHEKSISFYLKGTGVNFNYDLLKGIFINQCHGFWGEATGCWLKDWSLLLPAGIIILLVCLIWAARKRRWDMLALVIFSFGIMITNSVMVTSPRYLMPLIPVFSVLVLGLLGKYWKYGLLLIIASLPSLLNSFSNTNPQGDIQAHSRFINTRAYRELYRSIVPPNIRETDFITQLEDVYNQIGTLEISSQFTNPVKIAKNQYQYDYQVIYNTIYGKITQNTTAYYTKYHNQWKLEWKPELILPNYNPDATIVIRKDKLGLSEIRNNYGNVIAKQGHWHLVCVIPRLMYDWNKSVNEYSRLTGLPSSQINHIIRQTIPDDFIRCLAPLRTNFDSQQVLSTTINSVRLINYDYLVPIGMYKLNSNINNYIHYLYENYPEALKIKAVIEIRDINGNNKQEIIPELPVLDTKIASKLSNIDNYLK